MNFAIFSNNVWNAANLCQGPQLQDICQRSGLQFRKELGKESNIPTSGGIKKSQIDSGGHKLFLAALMRKDFSQKHLCLSHPTKRLLIDFQTLHFNCRPFIQSSAASVRAGSLRRSQAWQRGAPALQWSASGNWTHSVKKWNKDDFLSTFSCSATFLCKWLFSHMKQFSNSWRSFNTICPNSIYHNEGKAIKDPIWFFMFRYTDGLIFPYWTDHIFLFLVGSF